MTLINRAFDRTRQSVSAELQIPERDEVSALSVLKVFGASAVSE